MGCAEKVRPREYGKAPHRPSNNLIGSEKLLKVFSFLVFFACLGSEREVMEITSVFYKAP